MKNIAIIGDYNVSNSTHLATNDALEHMRTFLQVDIQFDWVATDRIKNEFLEITKNYDGFLISPGSPYKDMSAVLKIICYARENKVPTLGTCGGFQHMVIEFARNVMGITDAQHAEEDPYASTLVINPLSCSLYGQKLEIKIIEKNSKTFSIIGSDRLVENYYCNFGLNPIYQQQLHDGGLRITGSDSQKEARIIELDDHPFYIGTLFVPQANSTVEKPHPIIVGFGKAVLEMRPVTKGLETSLVPGLTAN